MHHDMKTCVMYMGGTVCKKPGWLGGIALGLSGVRFPEGLGIFHHRVQTSSGTHRASYSMGTSGS